MNIIHRILLILITTSLSFSKYLNLNLIGELKKKAEAGKLPFVSQQLVETVNGNKVEMFGISGNDSVTSYEDLRGKPVVLLTCMMHPREETANIFLQRFMEKLINDYANDQEIQYLLKKVAIVAIPYVNIDGVKYYMSNATRVEQGEMRKNMHYKENEKCKWMLSQGVDINRNFDVNFGTVASSEVKCGEEYRGQKPFSEREAQAVKMIFDDFKVVMSIDIHSYGDVWIYPFASISSEKAIKDHALYPKYEQIFQILDSHHSKYENCWNSLKYLADGVFIDWALQQNAISFALQFGQSFKNVGNRLAEEIETTLAVLKSNYKMIKKYRQANNLCIMSLSTVTVELAIKVDGKSQGLMLIEPDSMKCTAIQNTSMTIAISFAFSNLKEEVIDFSNLPLTEEIVVEEKQNGFQLIRNIGLGIGALYLIGSICGLSVFCERARSFHVQDEEFGRLNVESQQSVELK